MLLDHHRQEWQASGVHPDIIEANVWSIEDARELDELLNRNTDRRWKHSDDLVPGWAVAGIDPATGERTYKGAQFKPDTPRPQMGPDGKPKLGQDGQPKSRKYESPSDDPACPLFLDPGADFWGRVLSDPAIPVFITEGAKKAGAGLSRGLAVISLPGVSTGQKLGRLKPELLPFCRLGRKVYLAFDSDLMSNRNVALALDKLGRLISAEGAIVRVCRWGEETKGLDDYFQSGGDGHSLTTEAQTFEEWRHLQHDANPEEEMCRLARSFHLVKGKVGDRLKFNQLTRKIEIDADPIDLDTVQLELALKFNISISEKDCKKICKALAMQNPYHPIRDYLESVAREYGPDCFDLNSVTPTFLGSDDPLHIAMVRKTLISAVARIFDPGCPVQTVLILQSTEQEIGKSTFFRTLAVREEWFDDSMGAAKDSDERLKLHKTWIIEWAELETIFKRKDISAVKSFITCQNDLVRAPYERSHEYFPRPSILVGTTNEQEFLADPTGNRRFWIVPVSKPVDLDQLRKDRDRIWAAAVHAYRAHESWKLPPDLAALAKESTKGYEISDPWEGAITDYCEDREVVTTSEILSNAIGMDLSQQDRRSEMRIAHVLRSQGWTSERSQRQGKRIRLWKKSSIFEEKVGQVGQQPTEALDSKDLGDAQPLPNLCPTSAQLPNLDSMSAQPAQPAQPPCPTSADLANLDGGGIVGDVPNLPNLKTDQQDFFKKGDQVIPLAVAYWFKAGSDRIPAKILKEIPPSLKTATQIRLSEFPDEFFHELQQPSMVIGISKNGEKVKVRNPNGKTSVFCAWGVRLFSGEGVDNA